MEAITNLKDLNPIEDSTIKAYYIQGLANQPNRSRNGEQGLTATELKQRFDALPTLIIEKLNTLIGLLQSDTLAANITLDKNSEDFKTLAHLFAAITNGKLYDSIVTDQTDGEGVAYNLPAYLNELARTLSESITAVDGSAIKIPRLNIFRRVPVISSSEEAGDVVKYVKLSKAYEPNSIVLRDENGHIFSLKPTDSNHVAIKGYVDGLFADCFVKQIEFDELVRIPTIKDDDQGSVVLSDVPDANTVPLRTANGGVLVPFTPSEDDEAVSKRFTDKTYAKKSDISKVYRYCGSVQYKFDLQDEMDYKGYVPEVGDVWNIDEAEGDVPAGTNYVWDGTKFEPLGGTIDLSSYYTRDEVDSAIAEYVAAEIDRGVIAQNLEVVYNDDTGESAYLSYIAKTAIANGDHISTLESKLGDLSTILTAINEGGIV